MIGFTIPVVLWPGDDGGQRSHVDAVVRWDLDGDQPELDLRLPRDEAGNQPINNLQWDDLAAAMGFLESQKWDRDQAAKKAEVAT